MHVRTNNRVRMREREERKDKRTQITCIRKVSPACHGLPLIKNIFTFLSSLDTIGV